MNVLVVLPRIPYPLEKGDKLRAYYQIKELSKHHKIYLIALYNKAIPHNAFKQLAPFCQEIHFLKQNIFRSALNMLGSFFSGLPLQCGYYYSHKNHTLIDNIVNDIQPDVIYCQLFRMAEYVRHYHIPKVLDYQDAFSKGMERRAERASFFKKWIMQGEARRIAKYETEIFDDFNKKTIITTADREHINHPMRDEIVIVPNGVDFENFTRKDKKKDYDLIFSGNMNYAPNVDAAVYLCKEIFPELEKKHSGIKLMIAGTSPAAKVRALATDNITITGWVPSMVDCYAAARIFVAPMRLGTGLQNKLLEAMSMGLPCVTSPLAAQAMLPSKGAILQCSSTLQYIETIDKLLTDSEFYNELSNSGNRFVHENYDWSAATEKLSNILDELK